MANHSIVLGDLKEYLCTTVRPGLDVDEVLADCCLPSGAENDFRLTRAHFRLVILNANRLWGDETHGVCSKALKLGHSVLALHALSGCGNLTEAIRLLEHCFSISNGPLHLYPDFDKDGVSIRIEVDAPPGVDSTFLEGYWLSWICTMLSWFSGKWLPFAGRIRNGWDPFDGAGFDPRIEWQKCKDSTAVRLSRPHLSSESKLQCKSRYLFSISSFIERSEGMEESSFVMEETGGDLTKAGAASLKVIAAQNGISVSTLARRFKESGTSFREVAAAQKLQNALVMLRETDLPLDEIAHEVGYSDARSLRRFLKNATGQTSTELRERSGIFCERRADAVYARRIEILEQLELFASGRPG